MMRVELHNHQNYYLQETPWQKKCKAEVWFVFVSVYIRPPESWEQQAREYRRKQKVNIYQRQPASLFFLSGRVSGLQWDHSSMCLLHIGNSLLLSINRTDTPRHLGEQKGGWGVGRLMRQEQSVWCAGSAQSSNASSILKQQAIHRDKED